MNLILKVFSYLFLVITISYSDIIDDLYKINYVYNPEKKDGVFIFNDTNSTIISKSNLYEVYVNRIIDNGLVTVETIDYYLNNNSNAVSYSELMIKLLYTYSVESDMETSKLYFKKIITQGVENNFNSFESILLTDIAINLKYPIDELYSKNLCYIVDLDKSFFNGCLSNYFLLKNLKKENYNLNIIPKSLYKYIKKYTDERFNNV